MHRPDAGQTDGGTPRLGRRGEKGPEADVVRAFFESGESLAPAVGGAADDHPRPDESAHSRQGTGVLPHVQGVRSQFGGQVDVVVEHEERAGGAAEGLHDAGVPDHAVRGEVFGPQLHDAHPAFEERLGFCPHFAGLHIARVHNAVQAAGGEDAALFIGGGGRMRGHIGS